MFPNDQLSDVANFAPFQPWLRGKRDFKSDMVRAGLDFNNAGQGLDVQLWKVRLYDNGQVTFAPEDSHFLDETLVVTFHGANEVTGTFDNNMQPAVSIVMGSDAKLYWYDATISAFRTDTFTGVRSPLLRMDDVRDGQSTNRDMIFSYIRNNKVYFRKSRERFLTERELFDCHRWQRIHQCGMNIINCYQWQMCWDPDLIIRG